MHAIVDGRGGDPAGRRGGERRRGLGAAAGARHPAACPRAARTSSCAATRLGLAVGRADRAAARARGRGTCSRCRRPTGWSTSGSPTSRSTGRCPTTTRCPSDAEVAAAAGHRQPGARRAADRATTWSGAYAGLRPLVLPASAGTGPGRRHGRPLPQAPAAVGRTGPHRGRRQADDLPGDGRGDGGRRRRAARSRRAAVADRAAAAGGRGAAAGAGAGRRRRRGWSPGTARRRRSSRRSGRRRWSAGRPETVGELRFAVRHEGARTVADLLDRRTRIGLVPADRAARRRGRRAGAGRGALAAQVNLAAARVQVQRRGVEAGRRRAPRGRRPAAGAGPAPVPGRDQSGRRRSRQRCRPNGGARRPARRPGAMPGASRAGERGHRGAERERRRARCTRRARRASARGVAAARP